ncbi:MAG: UDP-N-acetylmuramate dehydrogenase [Lachnospiraceae bacterium]|nr:UDP-N-acetylmuramate dehydrogenase [Lachnospiraceae bacterium]
MSIDLKKEIEHILGENQLKIEEPLSCHTTFKMGGKADYFAVPQSLEEIVELIKFCNQRQVPFYILGNGSNVLVGDKGFRGVIIQIGKGMDKVEFGETTGEQTKVLAGAGVSLAKMAKMIASKGLTGFEFASGIPGTLGGAITMNAGAYGGEIKDCILWAKIIDKQGQIHIIEKEDLDLGYRKSVIQKEGYIVVEAEFIFSMGVKEEIEKKMTDLNRQRVEKQPLNYPSAGSTFKRPEGFFAGKLIMDAGLAGYRVGDIMVSTKHCGFVVNVGAGTAKDARQLIEDVSRIVYEKFQVKLEPEVRYLGEF